ncbi:Bactericidal permeability-increasing protein [Oopsacas minuta]|uniref:Bactericidal permeability-increasing protein n=1 Tax=Oopsacas minuta TaxID=111878 RepID=A0AAV7JW18_9METZ|nr:Bactericidal permeability-increasing protein [Oopsacas minuta]
MAHSGPSPNQALFPGFQFSIPDAQIPHSFDFQSSFYSPLTIQGLDTPSSNIFSTELEGQPTNTFSEQTDISGNTQSMQEDELGSYERQQLSTMKGVAIRNLWTSFQRVAMNLSSIVAEERKRTPNDIQKSLHLWPLFHQTASSLTSFYEGLGLLVTKSGFYEISDITQKISEIAPSIKFPDIGPFKLKETHLFVDYDLNITLHDVKIHTINMSEFSIQPSEESGLSILLKMSVNLETNALLKGKMIVTLIPIPISGNPKVQVDIVNLDCAVSFKLKRNATGDFELEDGSLKSVISVSKLHIKFIGDTPEIWLLNIIDLLVSWGKNLIVKEIHRTLPSIIEQVLNSMDLVLHLEMAGYSNLIDLHLLYDPAFTNNYMEIQCNGTISLVRNTAVYPHSPAKLPSLQQDLDNMLYVWVSNYTINSAIWAYYKADLLSLTISPYNLPNTAITSKLLHLLNTNFYEYLIPPLYRYYPNKNLTIYAAIGSPPGIAFYNDVIGISLNLTIDIKVNESNKFIPAMKFILAMEISSSVNLTNYEDSLYLQPHVISFHHNLRMLTANPILGNINKLFELVNRLLYDPFFVKSFNKLISNGYNLTAILDQLPIQIISPNIKAINIYGRGLEQGIEYGKIVERRELVNKSKKYRKFKKESQQYPDRPASATGDYDDQKCSQPSSPCPNCGYNTQKPSSPVPEQILTLRSRPQIPSSVQISEQNRKRANSLNYDEMPMEVSITKKTKFL